MATAFNLTAQLNLRGPSNVNKIVADIKKQLSGITANVNMKLDPNVAKNVKVLDASLKSLNATLSKTTTNASSAASAMSAFGKAVNSVSIKNIPSQINATVSSMNKLNKSSANIGRSLTESATEMQEFGKQAGLAIRRFAAFSAVTGVIYSLTNSISQGVQAFIDYDRELVRLQQVTGQSASGLKNLQKSISELATGLGVSSKELTTVSVTLAQAGLTAKDTERALRALALSSLAPSFDDMNETVEGSIALMRQFGISAGQLEQALGSINSVAAAFAVEADDLITAIQRTGGVFATASKGVSEGTDALNEFISVFTSVRATTRESAETIATGLRTIFTRIQRGSTIEALKEFGVTLTDSEGKFVGAYKAVQLLSEGLSKLDPRDIKFSRIVEELGGFRQIGKVIPLIQQFSVAQEALKVAQGGQASLAKDAATAQLSLANQIQKVREEFFALFREIGQSKGFQTLVTGVLSLTSGLIKLADVSKSLLPALSVILAFKGASALTQFASGFSKGFRPGGGKPDQERPRFNNGGRVRYFATGGYVPGSGGADNVPAMLTPGEFVVNKKAASRIGRKTLHRMNRYAGGGAIRAGISDIEIQNIEDGDTFTASVTPKTEPFNAKFRMGSYDAYETGNKRSRITSNRLEQIKKYNTRSGALDEIDENANPIAIPSYTRVKKGTTASEAAEEGKNILANKLASISKTSLVKKINQTLDVEGGFGRYLADLGKILPDELTTGRTWKTDTKNLGGLIKKFASGGIAQRRVGYIDYDVIANDANKTVVEQGMKATGSSGPRIYADYLTDLAVKARKNSSLQKLRAIYGVAGSGKTTLARGQGTDSAALRQTERFPVLSPDDIDKATEILVLSSSVSKKKLDEMFSATDRTYTLSSTTRADKDRVRSQRAARDTTGVGLEGRKPGSTTGVATDTAVGEALLSDALGDKSVVLGRNNRGGLRRKQGNELVDIVKKKIGFTWGGFAPMTAGHESIMDAAAAMGYSPEDFIYLVGANEGIKAGDPSSYRTAVFDQDFRVLLGKAGAGAKGARVLPKPRDFEVPQAFDISDDTDSRRKVLIPGKGSRAFVADKTEEQTAKYKEAGYGVTNLERMGGISGTMVRDLIMSGNMKKLQDVLSPGVYELISNNIGRLQNRANALPSIIEQVRQTQGVQLADVEKQIKALGISRIDNKKVESDPEYAAKVAVLQELRGRRDKIKSAASFEPYRLLDMMAQKEPGKYGLDLSTSSGDIQPIRTVSSVQKAAIGGLIRKFNDAGLVSPATGKAASRSDILKVLTREEAAAAAGISSYEIYELLGLRNPNAQQQAMRDAIQKEYTKKLNRKAGAARGVTTRLQNKGFEFGAAGMFGNAFAAENMDIESDRLSRSAKVRVVSGVMKKEVADKLDSIFATGTEELVRKGAQAVQQGYGQNDPLSALFGNANADASIGGGLLEKVIQALGGPGTVKGKGFDFPDGLKGAAKYFSLPPDIPTDVKRTLDGASTIKDNIVTYLKNVAGYADGGKVSLDDVRKKIADQYPDYKFRINPKSSGFGYRMLARPAAKDAPESLMAFDLISRLSDAPNTAKQLIDRIKEQEQSKKFASGGSVDLYHGSNTGVNDSVLESFKKEGARSDIAKGYGQGAGFYMYTEKNRAVSQAKMRVGGGGGFTLAQGDKSGKPMVLSFNEKLTPQDYDLDYELQKGLVVNWLNKNYDTLKDKIAPKLTADTKYAGVMGVVNKNPDQGIMSDAIRVQDDMGSRKTIYAGSDGDIREGELIGKIMNRLQANDPAIVHAFESELFKAPLGLTVKYVGSSPLKPTNIETFASGGLLSRFADGGMVPALLTPGEAVIPPAMAKKIGYSKLSRMNRADRNGMGRYANGGGVGIVPGSGNTDSFGPVALPVGSFVIRKKATEALGFNSGGMIPQFAAGGNVGTDITNQIMSWLSSDMVAARKPQMASRPDVVSRATVAVSDDTTKSLDILVKSLNQLGLSAANSAEILNKGGEVSYKTIEKALVKDIERLKISNASIDSIVAAETTLANIRKKSKEDVSKQKNLQGMTNRRGNSATQILGGMKIGDLKSGSGAGQQAIDTQAKMIAEEKIKARGGKVTEKQRSKIMESSYVDAASKVTGIKKSDFKAAGISGGDIQKYIAESMKDRKTLSQMDKQLIALRLEEYNNAGTVRGIAVKSAKEAEALAQEEVSTRRKIINDLAAQQGEKGVGAAGMLDFKNSPILNQIKDFIKSPGRVMGGISTVAGLAAGSSDLIAKQLYDTSTVGGKRKAAGTGAAIQSSGTILSTGMAAASQMAAIPVVGPYVAGITAVGTAALAAADYFGDFTGAQKEAVRALESELRAKEIGQATDDLGTAFQKFEADMSNIDLQQALNQALSRAVTLQAKDTTASIGQAEEDYAKNNRSWMGYFMGEKPIMGAPERNEVNRAEAAKYSQFADKGYAQIQSEINRGSSLDQIMKNDQLTGARRAIALSDASGVNQFYSQTQAARKDKGRDLTDAEEQAILDQIAATKIESDARIKAAIKSKQLADAMEAANRAGRRLAESFQSMTETIDQAINRVQKESKIRQAQANSLVEARRGNAGFDEAAVDNRNIGVLTDPKAYRNDPGRVEAAIKDATSGMSPELAQKMAGGARLEMSLPDVMKSAINDSLKNNAGASLDEVSEDAKKRGIAAIKASGLSEDDQQVAINKLETSIDRQKEQVQKDNADPRMQVDAFADSISELGPEIAKMFGNAGRALDSIISQRQSIYNTFAKNLESAADAARKARDSFNKARDIRYNAKMDLREAQTGVKESYDEAKAKFDDDIKRLTGGATDPQAIGQNIDNLMKQQEQQTKAKNAVMSDPNLTQDQKNSEVARFTKDIQATNNAINDNREALDKMANSAELAQKALDEVKNVKGLQQDRENFVNQLLTNTPEEADKLNQSFIRLGRNLSGGLNTASNQRDAQNAFMSTLRRTGNVREATRAGNTVLADQRKQTLQLMQDPGFRGMMTLNMKNQGMSDEQIDKNFRYQEGMLMQQMARESGMINNPMVQQALAAKQDPNADPAMKKAADQFLQSTGLQAKATEEQGRLELANVQTLLATATDDLRLSIETLTQTINSAIGGGGGEGAKIPGIGGDKVALNLGVRGSVGVPMLASKGRYVDFQPKGTDTIPAMLTRGEFVVNAKSTAQNRDLLEAINSGKDVQYAARGGLIRPRYLVAGGLLKKDATIEQDRAAFEADVQAQGANYGVSQEDQQEAARLRNERDSANQELMFMQSGAMVDESARQWTQEQFGSKWDGMTEEQRNAEIQKNLPRFQQLGQDYTARRDAYVAQKGSEDEATGLWSKDRFTTENQLAFFRQERERSEAAAAAASQAEYDQQAKIRETNKSAQDSARAEFNRREKVEQARQIAYGEKEVFVPEQKISIDGKGNVTTAEWKPGEREALIQKRKDEALATVNAEEQKQGLPLTTSPSRAAESPGYSMPLTGATSTNQVMGAVASGVDPRIIAAQQSAAPVSTQPQETDVQRYMRLAQAAGPQSMADFRKPTNMAEVGMYKEGLARGMTIDEIKYERQQAYLSRFRPDVAASMMASGKFRNAPSSRQVLLELAQKAQQQAAMGIDPYFDQRTSSEQESALGAAITRNLRNQGVNRDATPAEIASARKALRVSTATEQTSSDEPALASSLSPNQQTRYKELEAKRQAGKYSLEGSLSKEERQEWQTLHRGRELGSTPTASDNARRLALTGIAPQDRSPEQQQEYLRLKYQFDKSKGRTDANFDSYVKGKQQEQYDRDDKRFAALSQKESLADYDQQFMGRYKKQQADRQSAILTGMADREESFGSTMSTLDAAVQNNNQALAQAKTAAEEYKQSEDYKTDIGELTTLEQQRQKAEFDEFLANNASVGDPKILGEHWAKSNTPGFADLSLAEQSRLAKSYEKEADDFFRANVDKDMVDVVKASQDRRTKLQQQIVDKQNQIDKRVFGELPQIDQGASTANIDKIKQQADYYARAADELAKVKNVDSAKQIEAYRARSEELSARVATLRVGAQSAESATEVLATTRSGIQTSAQKLATDVTTSRLGRFSTGEEGKQLDTYIAQQEEDARKAQEAQLAADAKAKAEAEAQARAQADAQRAAADAEKKRQDGMWVNSDNPIFAGIGYAMGVAEAGGRVVRGGLYAGVGNLASAASGLVGNNTAEAERSRKLDAQIKENQRKQAEAGVLAARGEDQQAQLARSQAQLDAQTKAMETASIDAFKGVVDEGAAAGYADIKSTGTLILDPGNYQESAVGQFVDKQTQNLEQMGMSGYATINNLAGYASAGASDAIPSLITGGANLGTMGRLTGMTAARSGVRSAIKTAGRITGISDTITAASQAGSFVTKGAGKAMSVIGDTSFGRGVRTVTNAMGDTAKSLNPFTSRTQRAFIKQNMDAAYGVRASGGDYLESAMGQIAKERNLPLSQTEKYFGNQARQRASAAMSQDQARVARYGRLTGGDPTKASGVLNSRAARLDALKKARAAGATDPTIASRVESRKFMRFLDDMDAQKASDEVAFNNFNAAQARRNDPARIARRERMRAEGLARQKRVQRGLKRQEQFAAMTPEQKALERARRRGRERGIDIDRPAREKAKLRAADEKWLRTEIAREENKMKGLYDRYSYGGDQSAIDAARLRRRAARRGVNVDTANEYAIDYSKTLDDSGKVISETVDSKGLSRLDQVKVQQQQLAATRAAEAQARAQADDLRRTFGVGSPRTPTSRVMAVVDNQPKTAAQVAAAVQESVSPNIAITRTSLERSAQRTAKRQQALARGVNPKTGLKPGAKTPPAPAVPTPIKTATGTAQSTVDRVRTAQQTLKDRLANFTSSDEAAQRLQSSNAFDIDALVVDPKMRKRGASGVENTNALGRYFGGGKGKRTMQLKSNDIRSDVIEHELGHAFQHNTGKFGGPRKQTKPGLMDRLLGRQGNNWNPAEKELMDSLGSDVKKFLKDPNGYDALRKGVKGDVSSMYSAQAIMDKPIELFTSLVQASRSGQFGANTQAVEMLKKLMKFHGYADGGMVYANNIAKPKGKDNIPAMLSRGEFVVKQSEAQKHMPLLEAINSGAYSRGGLVNYMANGGLVMPNYLQRGGQPSPAPVPAPATGVSSNVGVDVGGLTSLVAGLQKTVNDLGASIPSMSQVAENISSAVGSFVSSGAQVGDMITNAINPVVQGLREVNIPDQITVAGTVASTHTFNGAEAANNVLGTLGPTMEQQTNQQIGKFAGAINRGIGNLGEGALGPDTGQIMGQIGGSNYGTA